jgi:hypothetical protein
MPLYMVFDIESVGLHGEGFAVGWVVVDEHGATLEDVYWGCAAELAEGTQDGRDWIDVNVVPYLPQPNCASPAEVRRRFCEAWQRWRLQGAVLVANAGWPVEARFLARCVDDGLLDPWHGPYPLHEVATARLAAAMSAVRDCVRLPSELPAHHPTADARQAARLWLAALPAAAPPAGASSALSVGPDAALPG